MTGKNFMKLIISIRCIAIITAKSARKSPPRYSFILVKTTSRREEKFQISPQDGSYFANISPLQKLTTRGNKTKQQQHIETTRLQINRRPQPTRKTQSKVVRKPTPT